jgi:hypothetical protein
MKQMELAILARSVAQTALLTDSAMVVHLGLINWDKFQPMTQFSAQMHAQ